MMFFDDESKEKKRGTKRKAFLIFSIYEQHKSTTKKCVDLTMTFVENLAIMVNSDKRPIIF